MATGTILRNLSIDDVFISKVISVANGGALTITFPSAGSRANGFISFTGTNADRCALYAFSGMNGITPTVQKLVGANLDTYITTSTRTITFSPNAAIAAKIVVINNVGSVEVNYTAPA